MFVSLVSSFPSLPLLYMIDKVKGRLLRFVFLDSSLRMLLLLRFWCS